MDNKTAVEWFADKIDYLIPLVSDKQAKYLNSLKEQAKEMEKEQIAKAFDDGDYNYHYSRKTGNDFEDGKEYFNEVYG